MLGELRRVGTVQDIPRVIVLDPDVQREVYVGREVSDDRITLDSREQERMISRTHAKLQFSDARWKVVDARAKVSAPDWNGIC